LLALLSWQRAVADDLAAAVLAGTVTRVKDGDSLVVRLAGAPGGSIEVRLYGIDAPEQSQSGGDEAHRFLQRRVLNRRVEVEPVTQDSYDRMIGIVYRDGASVNAALVEGGHAWAYRRYLAEVAGADAFCRLEDDARKARRGLWAQPPSTWVPPWAFRQLQRSGTGDLRARDYSRETAADCLAAIPRQRPRGSRPSLAPAPAPAPVSAAGGCRIKGNVNRRGERIYHVPGDRSYDDTQINTRAGERWFCSEDEARAAGWRRARQ
jgi:endonuclease YncB( thermonuclease family)